jgi:putative inorganic carbon (hco3(-)) transporter
MMRWLLFILLNAALFIRPADLFPEIDVPIYLYLIILCFIASTSQLAAVINSRALSQMPIACCVLGILPAVLLSNLVHLQFGLVLASIQQFIKVIIYYLLFLAIVDTVPRLQSFLLWLGRFVVVLTALPLLYYHGIIDIPSLRAYQQNEIDAPTGESSVMVRLNSTGLFGDPNDLCNILVIGILITLFVMIDLRKGFGRLLCVAPLGMFFYALKLTHSRGGMMTLSAGVFTFLQARFGWKKTVLVAGLLLPFAVVLFSGRQMQVNVSSREDTSQLRIQLWAMGFSLFPQAPLFGIGMGEYAERITAEAHNSFVHTYVELGFLGGTLFSGIFYTCVSGLVRLGRQDVVFYDPEARRLRPYILGMISAYWVGLFSLSRSYTVPTYMVFGIVTVYLQNAGARTSEGASRFDATFVMRLLKFSVVWLIILIVFTKFMVRWS